MNRHYRRINNHKTHITILTAMSLFGQRKFHSKQPLPLPIVNFHIGVIFEFNPDSKFRLTVSIGAPVVQVFDLNHLHDTMIRSIQYLYRLI